MARIKRSYGRSYSGPFSRSRARTSRRFMSMASPSCRVRTSMPRFWRERSTEITTRSSIRRAGSAMLYGNPQAPSETWWPRSSTITSASGRRRLAWLAALPPRLRRSPRCASSVPPFAPPHTRTGTPSRAPSPVEWAEAPQSARLAIEEGALADSPNPFDGKAPVSSSAGRAAPSAGSEVSATRSATRRGPTCPLRRRAGSGEGRSRFRRSISRRRAG